MHRYIESDDVISYSSEASKKNIKLLKVEDIEYRDGFLFHSSGSTDIKINVQDDNEADHSISEAFEAEGSYTLDLQQCFAPSKHMHSRKRRSISEKMDQDMLEEDLKVHYDRCKYFLADSFNYQNIYMYYDDK